MADVGDHHPPLGVEEFVVLHIARHVKVGPLAQGLFDQKGSKKKAFYVLKAYYDEMEKKYNQ